MTTTPERKTKMLNLRFTPSEHTRIKRFAVDQGLSMQDAITRLIRENPEYKKSVEGT